MSAELGRIFRSSSASTACFFLARGKRIEAGALNLDLFHVHRRVVRDDLPDHLPLEFPLLRIGVRFKSLVDRLLDRLGIGQLDGEQQAFAFRRDRAAAIA